MHEASASGWILVGGIAADRPCGPGQSRQQSHLDQLALVKASPQSRDVQVLGTAAAAGCPPGCIHRAVLYVLMICCHNTRPFHATARTRVTGLPVLRANRGCGVLYGSGSAI